jgi:hypothetical protein
MKDQKETKIEFFFEQKLKVHIDCYSGRFYNGEIIEINSEKYFIILKDRVLGETPIMFEEIQNIEKMREDGE